MRTGVAQPHHDLGLRLEVLDRERLAWWGARWEEGGGRGAGEQATREAHPRASKRRGPRRRRPWAGRGKREEGAPAAPSARAGRLIRRARRAAVLLLEHLDRHRDAVEPGAPHLKQRGRRGVRRGQVCVAWRGVACGVARRVWRGVTCGVARPGAPHLAELAAAHVLALQQRLPRHLPRHERRGGERR